MKKSFPLLLLGALLFAACDVTDNLGEQIEGTYSGYAVASCAYFSNMASADELVIISANGTENVDVSWTSDTWGTTTITGASVISNGGSTYAISGTGVSLMGHGSSTSEYECAFSGTIQGGVATLNFSIPAVMGGLTIEFKQGDMPAALAVAGTYSGYITADCAYFKGSYSAGQSLTIETDDNATTCSVSYTSDTWGTFSISGVTVSSANGTYSLSGEGTCQMGMGGNTKEYECSFTGSIDAAKENPEFVFTIPAVMGGLTINFKQGDAPAEIVVPGTYSGYVKADCAYFKDSYADDQSLTIKAEEDASTYAVSYTSDTWGTFSISGVTVSIEDGIYSLSGAGTCQMGMGGNTNEYECSFTGSIDAAKENPEFVFTVPAVMGGLTMTFLPGSAPSEE